MPTNWPGKAALTSWLTLSGTTSPDDVRRVEPPLKRAAPLPDPPVDMLEHFATPGEFLGERDAALAVGNAARLAELDGSAAGVALVGCGEPQPFRRVMAASGATMYRGPAGRRRLLIGFGAQGALIGVPVPVMLQSVDAARWDVLILRDGGDGQFRAGVGGIGRNFAAVTRWLAPRAAKYQHVTCLGYGAGGLAAVWAGLGLGADRVVCVSGQRPGDMAAFSGRTRPLPSAFDAACACVDGSVSRPFAFIAAGLRGADMTTARALAAQTGGQAAGAAGYDGDGLLGQMCRLGRLQAFINLALTTPINAALQQRLSAVLRGPVSAEGGGGANQIPPVAKRIAPDGD